MNKLPTNQVQLANLIYSCIDLSEHAEGATLKSIILGETGKGFMTVESVESWLRGLPSACTIPFWDNEIIEILESCGNGHWSVDSYWRWCASRVMQFAKHPQAYA